MPSDTDRTTLSRRAALGVLAAPAALACAPALARQGDRAADAALVALLDEDHDAKMAASPTGATMRGDHRFDDRWADVSPEAIDLRRRATRDRLARLNRIDRDALSENRRLDYDLLKWDLTDRVRQANDPLHELAVDQLAGPHIDLPSFALRLNLSTDQQRADYCMRLERLPAYFAQVTANLEAGLASGRTKPRVVMGGVPAAAWKQAPEDADAREHAMFAPLRSLTAESEHARNGERLVRERVIPAFRAFAQFLDEEYVPGCRDSIACSAMPRGRAMYDSALAHHTTTRMSAEEINRIGVAEVARIRREMFETIARSDFDGAGRTGDELFGAFVEYLRTDPRFYYTDARDLLRQYRDIAKRVDQHMPKFFGLLPRLPYGVEEMPAFMAPTAPTAYYNQGSLELGVAGTFIANTYALDQRPKYEMVALTMHEAVPGHHHQIAIAQELEAQGLHKWRTGGYITAYSEGWALYTERLGLEMGETPIADGGHGLYEDPYDDFGRLSYEMWRALRLVVDTGMHALDWTREQAITFMLENSALTRTNIEREVDRYIAWPGQACGYKIGEIRIRALRAEAEAAIPDLSLRAFHDRVLEAGALPLEILDQRVRAWISAQAAG
ncbi:MAG: DUF885 domain-containing protein [Phycisphaerales bacterium]